jgi:hypothetical protein
MNFFQKSLTIFGAVVSFNWCWENSENILENFKCNDQKDSKTCIYNTQSNTNEEIFSLLEELNVNKIKEKWNDITFLLENVEKLNNNNFLSKFENKVILQAFFQSSNQNKEILRQFIEENQIKNNFIIWDLSKLLNSSPENKYFEIYDFFKEKINIKQFLEKVWHKNNFIISNFLELKKRNLIEDKYINIEDIISAYFYKKNNIEIMNFLYEKVKNIWLKTFPDWKTELILIWLYSNNLSLSKKNIQKTYEEIWIISYNLSTKLKINIINSYYDNKKISDYKNIELILVALKSNNMQISKENIKKVYDAIYTLSSINSNYFSSFDKWFFTDKWIKNFLEIDKNLIKDNEDRLIVARNLYEKNLEPTNENVNIEYKNILKLRKKIWEIDVYKDRKIIVSSDWLEYKWDWNKKSDKWNWYRFFNKNTLNQIKNQLPKAIKEFRYKKWDNEYIYHNNFLNEIINSDENIPLTIQIEHHWTTDFAGNIYFFISKNRYISTWDLAKAYIERNKFRKNIQLKDKDIFNIATCFSYNFSKQFYKEIEKYNKENKTNIKMPIIINETDWPFQSAFSNKWKFNSDIKKQLFENWWIIKIKNYYKINDRWTPLSIFWWSKLQIRSLNHTSSNLYTTSSSKKNSSF